MTGACAAAGSSRTGGSGDLRDAVIFPVGWTSPNARRIGEAKGRIGDGKLDLIIGGMPRGALISWGDRASKFMGLIGAEGKTAAAVTEAIVRRMAPIRDRGYTGTADHGQEFARHREIAAALGVDLDFATPDHFWERGLNEHIHGLVRQSFPKGTDFRQVTPA